MQSVCVFCGSRVGNNPAMADEATAFGTALAQAKLKLVYGGGNIGLMGVLADAVLAAGGFVTGVIPHVLMERELAHVGVQDMRVVSSMHTRKALMADLSDAFVALPGGLGTFEELCEILTWAQLGFHHKPIAILNSHGFYDPLLQLLDTAVNADFLSVENRNLLHVAQSVDDLMSYLQRQSQPPPDSAALHRLT